MEIPEGPRLWDEARRPLASWPDELERNARYWEWLDANPPPEVPLRRLGEFENKVALEIDGPAAADFEAFHMRHSIGYSWDHYSAQGRIISFRDTEGLPDFTALVEDGVVIHARGQDNASLTSDQVDSLDAACEALGWSRLSLGRL